MKSYLPILVAILFLPLVLSSCSSTNSSAYSPGPEPVAATSGNKTPMIRVGMTRAQVVKAWGEPSGKDVTGRGEVWVWGGQNWKRMIPYAGPFMKVQTSKVLFGSNGRVKDFRLTDKGDMMSDVEGRSGGFNSW